ncbi:uncharacterized protein PV06_06601 [Exophiala oligosperma]|uniref:Uncharacterized protein n=2 Tax=Chaetothyriales TaxID=34395 RepID=A0A0D2DZS0_9EURO|nr:uncharacterized protein PV06_06601 [Exophiala oligosperma]KAJ9628378.1 hypothetical protein H2204_009354 [Knufia peltigerae]KIW41004.1 hypothetical protein PV06_06601 [Exophiala oligosperma]
MTLVARQYYNTCYNSFGQAYRCRSGWYSWGRWVALGVILFAALFFFFLLSCFSARRRRRQGRQPYYGTGWAGQTPWGHGPAQYNPNYQTQQQPQYNQGPQAPPNYNQTAGGYYGENQGYFGGRQTDVEMQPPSNTYRGGDNVYQPPPGPPPNNKT